MEPKNLALLFALLGILSLFAASFLIQPKLVSNSSQLKENDFVKTQGKIILIREYDEFKIIKLDNNITFTCYSCDFKINQTISAEGRVSRYKNYLQINVDEIKNVD